MLLFFIHPLFFTCSRAGSGGSRWSRSRPLFPQPHLPILLEGFRFPGQQRDISVQRVLILGILSQWDMSRKLSNGGIQEAPLLYSESLSDIWTPHLLWETNLQICSLGQNGWVLDWQLKRESFATKLISLFTSTMFYFRFYFVCFALWFAGSYLQIKYWTGLIQCGTFYFFKQINK